MVAHVRGSDVFTFDLLWQSIPSFRTIKCVFVAQQDFLSAQERGRLVLDEK